MIQLLKKSLPSIGINKKSAIFEKLEIIQRMTANQHSMPHPGSPGE
jgi:hypothetical protein